MVAHLWLKLSSACLSVCGVLLVVLGVVMPIILHEAIEAGLQDSWMHKDKFNHWGQVPGHYDMNVTRGFTIYNVSNPKEVILGDKPRLVEIGPYPFREISEFVNWEYLDKDFKSRGQDNEDTYIAYNYHLNLSYQHDIPTPFPLNLKITGINGPAYATFYGLTRAPFASYSMQHLHDVVKAFEGDMFYIVYSYVLYSKFLSVPDFMSTYLAGLGFTNNDITMLMNDPLYGFASWKTLKMWVIATFQQNWDDGAMDILTNYFQISTQPLQYIVNATSLWYDLVQDISADMLERYGTNTPSGLRDLQWSTAAVTMNMPLDVGPVLYQGKLPSYLALNLTYNFIPEIAGVILGQKMKCASFYPIAHSLLAPNYSYPMTNFNSLLNLNNIAYLFTWYSSENYTSIVSQFDLIAYDQIEPLIDYLFQMGSLTLTLPDGSKQYDGYSLALSRLAYKAVTLGTVSLRNDAYYGVLSQMLYCRFSNSTCKDLLSAVVGDIAGVNATCSDPNIGWSDFSTWRNMEVWAKAAQKSPQSAAFKTLLSYGYLTSMQLSAILYSQDSPFHTEVPAILEDLAKRYSCSKAQCSYDEMFWLQWGTAGVSKNLPGELMQCGFHNSTTLVDWYPGRYLVPVEWFNVTHFNATLAFSRAFLSYDTFLNVNTIKVFFNQYLSRNFSEAMKLFPILSSTSIQLIAAYFTRLIPGVEIFSTYTAEEWLMGRNDPFIAFVNSMNVYEGGNPTATPFHYIAQNTTDPDDAPKHIMYSGKDDVKKTRNYYAYFGSRDIVNFGPKYNSYAPGGIKNAVYSIWNGSVPIEGSDGGQFGIHFQKNPTEVFVQNLMRGFIITYNETVNFRGLDAYRLLVTHEEVENSATNPKNAAYFQSPLDVPGYMNLTSQYGAPSFVNLPHCFLCDTAGLEMIEYYSFVMNTSSGEYLQTRIFPEEKKDQPYVDIEPSTGVGVRVSYGFTSNIGLQQDAFFPNFYQPMPGSPLYFPYYSLLRYVEYSDHQVSEVFGPILMARRMEKGFRIAFLIGGMLMFLAAFVLCHYLRLLTRKESAESGRKTEELQDRLQVPTD